MQRAAIGFGKDSYARDMHFTQGADDADGDFATVSD